MNAPAAARPERVFALWIPDWPPGVPEEELAQDPTLAERLFAPVPAALEEVSPGVELLEPGLCALRGRGPARYYGGEEAAAAAMLARVAGLRLEGTGAAEARIGIADGLFAAHQAARSPENAPGLRAPSPEVRVVEPGAAAAFLAPLPVERAADPELADTLRGLGIRTLGRLAALPEPAVRERFGALGVAAHRRARAAAPAHGAELRPRRPVRDLAVELDLEPPVETADQLAFACAQLAERLIGGLAEERLVCTALRVELTDDIGARHERLWAHPRRFTAADAVNRVRWQLAALPDAASSTATGASAPIAERGGAGIARVRFAPVQTDRAAAHEPALWSTEPDERVHHRFTQVQARLGHTGIGTAQLGGGRLLAERQQFAPWGTRLRPRRPARGPWPGALPGLHPSTVFPAPVPVELLDADDRAVSLDADDLLDARPARLRVGDDRPAPVIGWSLPWPLRERWWEGRSARWRVQVQTGGAPEIGTAWTLFFERDGTDGRGRWLAEGRYD